MPETSELKELENEPPPNPLSSLTPKNESILPISANQSHSTVESHEAAHLVGEKSSPMAQTVEKRKKLPTKTDLSEGSDSEGTLTRISSKLQTYLLIFFTINLVVLAICTGLHLNALEVSSVRFEKHRNGESNLIGHIVDESLIILSCSTFALS